MFRVATGDYRRGRVEVKVNPAEWAVAKETMLDERGTVLVGAHTSNFDLVGQWVAAQGIEMQALGLASPDRVARAMNWLRRRRGVVVTPVGVASLRMAITRLRHGGVVVTGIDRPISEDDEPVPFFGVPAHLPVGHIRLAMHTNSRVLVACCVQEAEGQYALRLAHPLEMEMTDDPARDVAHNCRRVLAIIEEVILQAPDQWLVFAPVWPEDDLN